MATSALIVGLAACSHSSTGPGIGVPRTGLLALARSDSAEPNTPVVLTFRNNQNITFTVANSDSLRTVFATFQFTPQSIAYRNDTLLADTSTVSVLVTVTPGVFGFTVGPSNLFFNTTGSPTVTLSYAQYADFSVADSSSKYATPQAFAQAMALWYQFASDKWRAQNTGSGGLDVISSALSQPGAYLLAAPK